MTEKKLKAMSEIQRALGMIDGAACCIENLTAVDIIAAAIEMIEKAAEELANA